MKSKKSAIPGVLYVLSGIVLILGIVQLALYMRPQLTLISDAAAQGATPEQISEYYWQQFMPQLLYYITIYVGITAVLFACGAVYAKVCGVFAYMCDAAGQAPVSTYGAPTSYQEPEAAYEVEVSEGQEDEPQQ